LKRTRLTQAQRLDDALSDVETFAQSAIGELAVTVQMLKRVKHEAHMRRMRVRRLLRDEAHGQ
jgi:hypothetical protein